MPLVPNLIENSLFVTFNQAPGPLLDLWGGPAFRVVLASVRLGIFPALGSRAQTAEELAQTLGLDGRGVKILLETLATLHLVKAKDGRYANTTMAQKWLTPAGEADFSAYFRYWARSRRSSGRGWRKHCAPAGPRSTSIRGWKPSRRYHTISKRA